MTYYLLFILVVGAERLVELAVSRRNTTWAIAHGGKEFGRGHYRAIVVMHALLLVACIVEVWALHRPFIPRLGWPMVAIVLFSTVVRWWSIAALGKYWNTRIIVIPGAPLVRRGPYRWLNHPNYAAVTAEGAALPLVHSAWLSAIVFRLANALVLNVRIREEDTALGYA